MLLFILIEISIMSSEAKVTLMLLLVQKFRLLARRRPHRRSPAAPPSSSALWVPLQAPTSNTPSQPRRSRRYWQALTFTFYVFSGCSYLQQQASAGSSFWQDTDAAVRAGNVTLKYEHLFSGKYTSVQLLLYIYIWVKVSHLCWMSTCPLCI